MNRSLNKFRLASQGLFNSYFLEELSNDAAGWEYLEYFDTVEESLFLGLVTAPNNLNEVVYGRPRLEILVKSAGNVGVPLMLNREIDSGYWDHPITVSEQDTVFTFIKFFDWDEMNYKDNRYVRAIVKDWPSRPELIGKHALIETHYVVYEKV